MKLPDWWKADRPYKIMDCVEGLKQLPDDVIDCCITSPPYYFMRNYEMAGQYGLEDTPEEYVATMVKVFHEIKRVLKPTGVCWVNLGDCYGGHSGGISNSDKQLSNEGSQQIVKFRKGNNIKPKDLIGVPWMTAFALRADGWYLRDDIIWHKTNGFPESVEDRPSRNHEYVFMLTKSAKYYFDIEAIKEKGSEPIRERERNNGESNVDTKLRGHDGCCGNTGTRRKRTVWSVPTASYSDAHFASYPVDLIRPMVLSSTSAKGVCPSCGKPWERITARGEFEITDDMKACGCDENGTYTGCDTKDYEGTGAQNPGDTKRRILDSMAHPIRTIGWKPTCECGKEPVPAIVIDPFTGSGTTLEVARKNGRLGLGFELNPAYEVLIKKRSMCEIKELTDYG